MTWLALPWMHAIGWALLHSLWQGMLIWGLAWLLLRAQRKASPQVRCRTAFSALGLMVASPLLTFWVCLPGGGGAALPPSQGHIPGVLEAWIPYATLGWLAGVAASSLRIGAGWFWLRRLRTWQTSPCPPHCESRMRALAESLGIPRKIRVLQSRAVDSPMVVGWWRPIILIPAATLMGLSTQALEAVLAHELAHIKRSDYLFNLLQSAFETLLFYHPGAWWLGRQIRQEREHAADDLAISLIGEPLQYARALADLESLRSTPSNPLQLAPAAHGGNLMQRIRRILTPSASPLPDSRPALVALLAIGVLGACTASLADEPNTPKTRRMVVREDGGRHIDLRMEGDAKLDPKSPAGVALGEKGRVEVIVRESPAQKKVIIRKNEKGVTQILADGKEARNLEAKDEAWIKRQLESFKQMDSKKGMRRYEFKGTDVPPGRYTFYMKGDEKKEGKDGKLHTFTFRSPEGAELNEVIDFDGEARVFTDRGFSREEMKKWIEEGKKEGAKIRKRIHIEGIPDSGPHPRIMIKKGGKPFEFEGGTWSMKGDGDHDVWMSFFGEENPKQEAEHIRKQIERLQKRLKEVESRASEAEKSGK